MSQWILEASAQGFLLPPVEGKQVFFKPDHVAWDAGILASKGGRDLFVMVVPRIGQDEQGEDTMNSFREVGMACIAIAATDAQSLCQTGDRIWVYNPRIHGTAQAMETSPVVAAISQPVVEESPVPPSPESPPLEEPRVPNPSAPGDGRENIGEEERIYSKALWLSLGQNAGDWNRAEDMMVSLADGRELGELACNLLGETAGRAWMGRSLLVLDGLSPSQADDKTIGIAVSALRKISLMARND